MASITSDQNGNRTIQFVAKDRKRRSIRCGKMSMKKAEELKTKVEALNVATITGFSIDGETARWVADLDQVLSEKLAAAGLIERRERHDCELVGFVGSYVDSRTDAKPNTLKVWRQTITLLTEFFGKRRSIQSITKGDATDWRLFLVKRGMAEASVRKHCGFAKHFAKQAVDREIIRKNPFEALVSASIGNDERQYFVTRDEIQKVLDTCPNAEWRLIVALSRYGGLRCPSEHFLLRWEDILWDQQRFIVHSPKTEKHQGRESRIVPLFPELLPYLEAVFDQAEPGQEFVIH
ncbi:MAG: integrase family protein, partial [Planctomycetota bacterium]